MPFIPLLILSLSLSLSLRSQTLLFSLSHTSLAFSSHTLSLMVETHVLPLPSCTLSLNQCYGDGVPQPWKRVFIFVFGFGSLFVFGIVCQTSKECLVETHELRHHWFLRPFSSFFVILFYFFFISLLFWFFLVWVLVNLWIEFSYDDKDLVIFYLSLKGGVYVLSFADLWVFFDLEFVLKWV